jgi:hypothetical protein
VHSTASTPSSAKPAAAKSARKGPLSRVHAGKVAHLVVADAGVDDDRLATRLDDEGVDRRDQATLGGREVRLEPGLRLHGLLAQVREQEARRYAGEERRRRAARFGNPRHGDVADPPAKRCVHAKALAVLTPALPGGDGGSW